MSCPLFSSPLPLTIGLASFSNDSLIAFALESGFMRRAPRKISPRAFFQSFLDSAITTSPSFNDLAAQIEAAGDSAPSRQAVAKRCQPAALAFIQAIFAEFLTRHIFQNNSQPPPDCFRGFTRVIVADSTLLKLPDRLFPVFSGTANATTQSCHCRIQTAYDLVARRFIYFSIDPYCKNDLAAAPDLELQKRDLVLRDRGYLTAAEIERHRLAGADCIYRHMTNFTYLDPNSNLPFDLLAHLKKHGSIDQIMLLNNPERTRVRVVGGPIDEAAANLKRMRARKETKGHNPSATVLALMSWSVYIVTSALWPCVLEDVRSIYALRWRIEIIFKSWKSHLAFARVHRLSEIQLRILLMVRLMLVVACTDMLYRPCQFEIKRRVARELSLLKFMRYLELHPEKIPQLLRFSALTASQAEAVARCPAELLQTEKLLVKYCCYEKRKRLNFHDQWEAAA